MQGHKIDHAQWCSNVAHDLMQIALQASVAARELAEVGPEAKLTAGTQDMLMKYRRMTESPSVRVYMHPTAAGIGEDEATSDLAVICAVRALKDALSDTALTEEGRRTAVASLLNELGTVEQVERAIADVRRLKMAKVSFHKGMRVLTKALHLAAYHGREGKALPAEGVDFIQHAAQIANQILPGPVNQSPTQHAAARLRDPDYRPSHVIPATVATEAA